MTAAGFILTSDSETDETMLVYPMLPNPELDLVMAVVQLDRLSKRFPG
jgi:hypothetical protein